MMKSLAAFAMRSPVKAVLVIVGLAVASLLFFPLSWPLSYFSAGVVALVVLSQGSRDSVLIVLGATALLAAAAMLLGSGQIGIGYALSIWLPTWLTAQWLKQSHSLGQTLLLVGLVGLAGILVMFLLMGNPTQWWSQYFEQQVIPALKQAGVEFPDEAAFRTALQQMAGLMTGILMASLVLSASIGIVIGRYWQSLLFQTGFGQEFRQLRLGTLAAGVALLIVALSQFVGGRTGEWLVDAAIVVIAVFLFQGLAIGHQLASRLQSGQVWIVTLYILLFFTMPYGAVVIATLGMLDNWIDIRRRFPGAAG